MSATVALMALLKKNRPEDGDPDADENDDTTASMSESVLTLTQEARLLVKALQANDISEAELLRMVNTKPSDFDVDNPERDGIIRRARKIFRYLDINNDGVVAPDDLQEIKGRLYPITDPQEDSLQRLRTEFLKNEAAVATLKNKAEVYLEHRQGYRYCFFHLAYFAVFICVLALQADKLLVWEVRRAVTQAVFPETLFGEDVTMVNSIVLTSTDEIIDWFEMAFVNDEGVFGDPACGDGQCSAPLEYPVWRDSSQQAGCSIDCGQWAETTPSVYRKAKVEFSVDPTLSDSEIAIIRWNVVCPTVTYFESQLKYFAEDQTVSSGTTSSNVYLFDCDWELRLYAPQGGVSGQITFASQYENSTTVSETSVSDPDDNTAVSDSGTSTTFAWDGCDSPLPSENEILGNIYLCTDSMDYFFNVSAFLDLNLQAKLEQYSLDFMHEGIEAYGLVSYFDVAPTCYCAGPPFTDCDGDYCPLYKMQSADGECPALCEAGQVMPTDGSEYDYPGDVREICNPSIEVVEDTECGLGAPGWDGEDGSCVDCRGCNCDNFTHWLGDGYCDNGAYGMYFNCPAFECDDADCEVEGGGCAADIAETTSLSPSSPSPSPSAPPANSTTASSASTNSSTNSSTTLPPPPPPGTTTTTTLPPPPPSRRRRQRRNLQLDFDLPCTYTAKEQNEDEVRESVLLKMSSFIYNGFDNPQCVAFQVKLRSDNATIGDFIREIFQTVGDNSTGTYIVQHDLSLANMTGVLGEPTMVMTPEPTLNEPANSTCNISASCIIEGFGADEIISTLDTLDLDGNPCNFLETVYGCDTAGCGCPYPECEDLTGCGELGSCDKYPWDSCETLEEYNGCDCSGCACTAGDDCPRTCLGMTCEELVALSNDDTVSYYLANPPWKPPGFESTLQFLPQSTDFQFLEKNYGCDCDGCSMGGLGGMDGPGRRRNLAQRDSPTAMPDDQAREVKAALRDKDADGVRRNLDPTHFTSRRSLEAYYGYYEGFYSYYDDFWGPEDDYEGFERSGGNDDDDALTTSSWPLDTVYCDEANACSLDMLLNGICDRACATDACNWDFYDCCSPSFASSSQTLDTRDDNALLTLSINNDGGATPYDAWDDTPVKRYVANSHRLIGGVLFDQQRNERGNCTLSDDEAAWAQLRTGHQVVEELTADATCETGSAEVETAGTDPTFQARSTLYDPTIDVDVCHPTGLSNGGFPFVRFPSVGLGRPLQWSATMREARREASAPGFFDLNSLSESELANVIGGYPVYFDCAFDYNRAIHYLQYMHDGYYIGDSTTVVDVKFLLYNQDINIVTYVKARFSIEDAGSLMLDKSITIFNPTPYNGDSWSKLRIFLELVFVVGIVVTLFLEVSQCIRSCKEEGKVCAHFKDMWNLLDLATILLQVVSALLWLECLTSLLTDGFNPKLVYDVYDINPDCPGANLARFNTTELTQLRLMYASADHFAEKYTAYSTVNTIVFVLMTMQLLHVLHFQPKLSLITRTMGAAWDDLVHLFMLFTLVELSFALLGNVIYGDTVEELSTLGHSLVTLLLALFGNYDVALALGELYGFQGYLFYFLYMAIAFLLLMNMLLAILVDAYINVKAYSDKADGVFTDLYRQTKATIRAVSRPKHIVSNAKLAKTLRKWLEHEEPEEDKTPRVVVGREYEPTVGDIKRVLRLFLESEHGLNQQARGIIDSKTMHKDVNDMAASLLYHHGKHSRSMDHSNASDSDKVYPVREQSNGVPARSTVALMRGVSEETADKSPKSESKV